MESTNDPNEAKYKGRFGKRIYRLILVAFLTISISSSMLLMAAFYYYYLKEVRRNKGLAVTHLSNRLETRIHDYTDSFVKFASNPKIVNTLLDTNREQSKEILQGQLANFPVDQVLLLDRKGNVLCCDPEEKNREAINIDKSSIFDLNSHSRPIFHIDRAINLLVPVYYYSKVQGILVVRFDSESLIQKVTDNHHAADLFYQDIPLYQEKNDSFAFLLGEKIISNQAETDLPELRIRVYGNENPFSEIIGLFAILGSGFLVSTVFLSMWLARRIGSAVAEPISLLVSRIRRNGDEPCYPIGSKDELELLAIAFDIKTQEILRINQFLEETVKQRTEQLVQEKVKAVDALKIRSQFIANMSHEIRTPLNGIIGTTDFLIEENNPGYPKDKLKIIYQSSKILLSLVNDILDFSKIESQKMTLESVPVDLGSLSKDVIEIFSFDSKNKGINLELDTSGVKNPQIKGDPTRMSQIFINLIGNGLKFTPKDGTVQLIIQTIKLVDSEQLIKFSVTDTGIGISPSRLKQLFNPFVQADTSTTRNYGGTGLGLTICQKLVQMMGGEISVKSIEGKGTTFSFEIAFSIAEQAQEKQPRLGEQKQDFSNIQLLVAEDNKINQEIIGAFLKKFGLTFDFADDGEEAIAMAEKKKYDLIFMDMQMPQVDGLTATREIRNSTASLCQNVPIVAMTANAMKEDEEMCLQSGMTGFVTKPVTKRKLAEELSKVIS